MHYRTVRPPDQLTDFVQYYWILEGPASLDAPCALRIPASGFPELIFHYQGRFDEVLSDQRFVSSFITGIHGQSSRFRDFTVNGSFGMIGVHLYPYALKALFDIPAIEFTNQMPDLWAVLKPEDRGISERVLGAKDNAERMQLISDFLERRMGKTVRVDVVHAVKKIIHTKGSISITDLADECFTSKRQFERNFKELAGHTAKSFARIIRFSSLYNQSDFQDKSLTEIAYDFGYSDQSHFIKDFKAFSGDSPKAWLSTRTVPSHP